MRTEKAAGGNEDERRGQRSEERIQERGGPHPTHLRAKEPDGQAQGEGIAGGRKEARIALPRRPMACLAQIAMHVVDRTHRRKPMPGAHAHEEGQNGDRQANDPQGDFCGSGFHLCLDGDQFAVPSSRWMTTSEYIASDAALFRAGANAVPFHSEPSSPDAQTLSSNPPGFKRGRSYPSHASARPQRSSSRACSPPQQTRSLVPNPRPISRRAHVVRPGTTRCSAPSASTLPANAVARTNPALHHCDESPSRRISHSPAVLVLSSNNSRLQELRH